MKTRWLINFLIGLVGALVIAVGLSLLTAATATVFFYYSITNLGILDAGNNGLSYFTNSAAYGLNDQGLVIGQSGTNTGASFPFVWSNGTMTLLGLSKNSSANSINNTGQVVGQMPTNNRSGIPSGPPPRFLVE
ncbi:MAG TPA: hypothetical protein V6D48_14330 [Oculatellaceae cyanobacterium]